TAVIAFARITLGVLVGELGALRFHHPRAGVVLRGDQLDVIFLALAFIGDGLGQFVVVTGNRAVLREHSGLGRWGAGLAGKCSAAGRLRPPRRGPGSECLFVLAKRHSDPPTAIMCGLTNSPFRAGRTGGAVPAFGGCMSSQYIFTMNVVSKIVPPKRQIIKDISLSFFPGAKIGLLGVNGAGK